MHNNELRKKQVAHISVDGIRHDALLLMLTTDFAYIIVPNRLNVGTTCEFSYKISEAEIISGDVAVISSYPHMGMYFGQYLAKVRWMDLSSRSETLITHAIEEMAKLREVSFSARMFHPVTVEDLTVTQISESGLFVEMEVPVLLNTFVRLEVLVGKQRFLLDGCVVQVVDGIGDSDHQRCAGIKIEIIFVQEQEQKRWLNLFHAETQKHPVGSDRLDVPSI